MHPKKSDLDPIMEVLVKELGFSAKHTDEFLNPGAQCCKCTNATGLYGIGSESEKDDLSA